MFSIRFEASIPIYKQIIDEVRRALAREELAPGDQLPSQRELALELKVNPNTVQRAYRDMEQQQLVETLRGQGTFIRQDVGMVQRIQREMIEERVEQFLQEMLALGCSGEMVVSLVREKSRRGGNGDDN